jgi:hypothetical protein
MSNEQPVLFSKGTGPNGVFDEVAVDLQHAVAHEPCDSLECDAVMNECAVVQKPTGLLSPPSGARKQLLTPSSLFSEPFPTPTTSPFAPSHGEKACHVLRGQVEGHFVRIVPAKCTGSASKPSIVRTFPRMRANVVQCAEMSMCRSVNGNSCWTHLVL